MTSINLVRPKNRTARRSVSRLYVQAIFALAAAVALSTSACGKQDGAKPNPGAQATAPDTANTAAVGAVTGTTPPLDDPENQNEKGQVLDRDKGNGDPELDENSSSSASHKVGEGEPDPLNKKKPKGPRVEESVESVIYYDPSGLTPDQVASKKQDVDQAGAFFGEAMRSDISSANGEPLFYSGAGGDNLRDDLYTRVNQRAAVVDEVTRAADKRLAQTIQLAHFNVDWSNRAAELNFRLERIGSRGVMVMSNVKVEGAINSLTRFEVGSLSKQPYIKVLGACMDISGGCKTVHLRVQDASSGTVETAHLIARHTNATLFVRGNTPGVSKNAEYDRLMGILLNTVNQPAGQNVVHELTLTTSETIGGASNFTVRMKIRLQDQYGRTGGDTLELTGPLAKPRNSSRLSVGLNMTPTLTVIDGQVTPTTAIGTQGRIVDTIREVRLLENDGRGKLELDLTVRSATVGAAEDKINLVIRRIHTPTGPVRIPVQ